MAIVQLILCIHSDFIKLKRSNIRKACQINLQKSICLSVICAAGSRATYFIFGLVVYLHMFPARYIENEPYTILLSKAKKYFRQLACGIEFLTQKLHDH